MDNEIPGAVGLRALLAEAGLTGQALADAVNRAGRECGIALGYDRTAVAHWLRGARPRRPVPELVAEVLSRHLGREVTALETGLGRDDVRTPDDRTRALPTTFEALTLGDRPTRRAAAAVGTFSLHALALPSWPELAGLHPPPLGHADRTRRTGTAETTAATAMTALFSQADAAYGGGHALAAISGYLATTVGPWLEQPASDRARRGLSAAAARLCYLAGFMSFDNNQHARAQRYYLTSLRLAHAAQDPYLYTVGLRALSVQARVLGHQRQALELAQAAANSAPANLPGRTAAFVHGHLAVAYATVGEHRAAAAELCTAERHLDRADLGTSEVGAFHLAALAHCRSAIRLAEKDTAGAINALTAALLDRPATERRSRALIRAQLAELHWSRGHVEAACTAWTLFLDDYPHLSSGRANAALSNLKALTRPQQRRADVAALRRRATALASV